MAEHPPVTLVSVDQDLALRAALMADRTKSAGLSLADRICLALGQRTGHVVLTAEKDWLRVAEDVAVRMELVR